jgi:long-chain acyl-CoA synthetase
MILVSGFNVYPNEVEDALALIDEVQESAVIGMPDEKTGEAVAAYIVVRDPSLTEQDVIAHCKKELAGYKVPKRIEFWDELPKTPVGKVLRKEVRATVEQQTQGA